MRTHYLKCWPSQFRAVQEGIKRHEWRRDDRDFHEGDVVHLCCWEPAVELFTGRVITATIGDLTRGRFGIPDGYCVFTLANPLPARTLDSSTVRQYWESPQEVHL